MDADDVIALVGRLLLAMVFLAAAFGMITNFEGTLQYMEAHGIPAASLFGTAAVAVEALGAVSLILGYKTRWGAAALAALVAAATCVFETAPDHRVPLLKNLSILGGLLNVIAFGPGPISLEGGRKAS